MTYSQDSKWNADTFGSHKRNCETWYVFYVQWRSLFIPFAGFTYTSFYTCQIVLITSVTMHSTWNAFVCIFIDTIVRYIVIFLWLTFDIFAPFSTLYLLRIACFKFISWKYFQKNTVREIAELLCNNFYYTS